MTDSGQGGEPQGQGQYPSSPSAPAYPPPPQPQYGQPQYGQYGQPPYGQPQYNQQPYGYQPAPPGYGYGQQQGGSNGLAIAGMICGIVGLVLFNIIQGPLALIFGGIGLSRANRGASGRGFAIASLVLGVADLIIFAILLAYLSNHGWVY